MLDSSKQERALVLAEAGSPEGGISSGRSTLSQGITGDDTAIEKGEFELRISGNSVEN
jgi:hypothetical protein